MQLKQQTDDPDGPSQDFSTMSAHDLIDWLNTDFPPICIRPGEPEWMAHRYAGRRELIDELVIAKNAELAAKPDE